MNFNKTAVIAVREFTHNLRRPSFLFAVLGLPLTIIVALLLVGAAAARVPDLSEYGKIGYVDSSAAQVLAGDVVPARYQDIFTRYATATAADAAARSGELSAYIELPADYFQSGRVALYTAKPAPANLRGAINALLRANLTAGLPQSLPLALLTQPPRVMVTVLDGNHTFTAEGAFFIFFLPLMFGFVLILTSVSTSSFLMSGLVEEKTNRIMEVLLTSVRPLELLLGKFVGMGLLGLLQVGLFLLAGLIGLGLAQRGDLLVGLSIPLDVALLAVFYYLLAYFMMAAIGVAIGGIAGSEKESRQLSGFFIMPLMLPYPLMLTFILDPNGSIPTLLTLVPFTAPMAVIMRAGLTAVPFWQILVSATGLILVNAGILWVAARLFHWGIFNSNRMPGLRQIYRVLRGSALAVAPKPQHLEVV